MSDDSVKTLSPEKETEDPEGKKCSKKSHQKKKSSDTSRKGTYKKDDSCSINPEEIPDTPPNFFLLRQTSWSPDFNDKRNLNGRRTNTCSKCNRPVKSRSGRKLKGRGIMRYRTPSPDGNKSGSETPPHWKVEQSRVYSIKDVKKSEASDENSWKFPWVEDSRKKESEKASDEKTWKVPWMEDSRRMEKDNWESRPQIDEENWKLLLCTGFRTKPTSDDEEKAHENKECRERKNSGHLSTKDAKNSMHGLWQKAVKDIKKASKEKPRIPMRKTPSLPLPPLPQVQVIKPKKDKSESSMLLMNYFEQGSSSESEEDTDRPATDSTVSVLEKDTKKQLLYCESDKRNNVHPDLSLKKTGDDSQNSKKLVQAEKKPKAKGGSKGGSILESQSLLMNYFKQGLSDSEEENCAHSPCDKVASTSKDTSLALNDKDPQCSTENGMQCSNEETDSLCVPEKSMLLCGKTSPAAKLIENNNMSKLLTNCHQSSSGTADDKNVPCAVANKHSQKQSPTVGKASAAKVKTVTKRNQNVLFSTSQSMPAVKTTKSKKQKSIEELILSNYFQHSSSDDDSGDAEPSHLTNNTSVPQKNNLEKHHDASATTNNKQNNLCSESNSKNLTSAIPETNKKLKPKKVAHSSPEVFETVSSLCRGKKIKSDKEHCKDQDSRMSRDKFKKYRSEIYKEEITNKHSETVERNKDNEKPRRHTNDESTPSGRKLKCSSGSSPSKTFSKNESKLARSKNTKDLSISSVLRKRHFSSRLQSSSPECRISQLTRSVCYEASSIIIRRARSRSCNRRKRKDTPPSEHDQKRDLHPCKQSQNKKRKMPSEDSQNVKSGTLSKNKFQNKRKRDVLSKKPRNRKSSTSSQGQSPDRCRTNRKLLVKKASCTVNHSRQSKQNTKRYSHSKSRSHSCNKANKRSRKYSQSSSSTSSASSTSSTSSSGSFSTCDTCSTSSSSSSDSKNHSHSTKKCIKSSVKKTWSESSSCSG